MSPEGVVLGADSTSSIFVQPGGFHFFNHNQKLFQIGEEGTLGALTWGLGGLGETSHRTLLGYLADDLARTPPISVADVASRWAVQFWNAYSTSPQLAAALTYCKTLAQKPAFDPDANVPDPTARTKQEEEEFLGLQM
jgi:hypothetical protein